MKIRLMQMTFTNKQLRDIVAALIFDDEFRHEDLLKSINGILAPEPPQTTPCNEMSYD